MAVCSFKTVSIVGTSSALDFVAKICADSCVFQPISISDFCPEPEGLVPFSEESPFSGVLKKMKDVSLLFGKKLKIVDIRRFNARLSEIKEFVDALETKAKRIDIERKELIHKINKLDDYLKLIRHFCGLNIDLKDIARCEYVKVRFGRLSKENYKKLEILSNESNILFFPCSEEGNYFWGIYFAPIKDLEEIDSFFSGLYFEHTEVDFESCQKTPEMTVTSLENDIKAKRNRLSELASDMERIWDNHKEQCCRFFTKLKEFETYFSIKTYSYVHSDNFLLMGWIPEDKEVGFCNSLDTVDSVEYKVEVARGSFASSTGLDNRDEKVTPPVKLKNNWFSRPFENFVKMYGLPRYKEFDPTTLVAVTFTILYGMMFGDLGHGLTLLLAGLFLGKLRKFSLAPVMTRCGVSASAFGTLYGSLFGFENALNPLYKFLFGFNEKPIEVMSSKAIPVILACAVFIGVIFVLLAMLVNTIGAIRCGDIENGVFGPNGICGIILYSSVVFAAVCNVILKIKLVNFAYILFLFLLPLFLIFFKFPAANLVLKKKLFGSQSIIEYVLQNVFEIFTVILEYITNTVSFLRVGAYVLVHSGLMMAIFMMANMFPLLYIPILVIGNIFVIGFEGLLVGIQVLRLEFYEVFSRCFSGGGEEFNPVRILNTEN